MLNYCIRWAFLAVVVAFLLLEFYAHTQEKTQWIKEQDLQGCRAMFDMGPTSRALAYSAGCVLEIEK